MAGEDATPELPLGRKTTRLEAFSDGVFAIAITLLVLEISVPSGSEDDLLRAIVNQWHLYLAYLVSFATIGVAWLAHTAVTDYLHRANAVLLRLNLLLLLFVAFIPFPTKLLGEYSDHDDAERVAATFYGLTLFVTAVLVSVLWRYAVHHDLVRPDAADEEVQTITRRLTPGLAGYVVLIGVGLFLPNIAVLGYLLIAIALLVPIGSITHRAAPRPD